MTSDGDGKTIVLHIGTHKTGTTSIQSFLETHRGRLLRQGVHVYCGALGHGSHIELPLAALRPDRTIPAREGLRRVVDAGFRAHVAAHVQSFLALSPARNVIFSAEGLSYLRHVDELAFLSRLFEGRRVQVVVYLRNPKAFLRSYSAQIRQMGFQFSSDKTSFAYCEADSWLADYDALVGAYAAAFGRANVIVKTYEEEVAHFGSVVPSFLGLLPLSRALRVDFSRFWLNKTETT